MALRARPPTPASGPSPQTIVIDGVPVALTPENVPLDQALLDPTNPRVQFAVAQAIKGKSPTQDQLTEVILKISGVDELLAAIRNNGGLQEPIYIRADGRVAEGNCRTACYRKLREKRASEPQWKTIPAFRLPTTVTEKQIAILQAQVHVAGKNKWKAFEQAGHIHTMLTKHGMDSESIAKALGIQKRSVLRDLQTYEVMSKKILPNMPAGKGLDKWSHTLELFKNKKLEEFRKDEENVDLFAQLVVDGKIKKGADVRRLSRILPSKKATKILIKNGLDEAIEHVAQSDPTATSPVLGRIKNLAKELRTLGREDQERIKKEDRAKEILVELFNAVQEVAEFCKVRLG